MIRHKPGVSLDRCHHRVYLIVAFAAPVWAKYGSPDLVVTAGNEAGHTTNPDPRRQFHQLPDGSCQAVDLRTWTIPEPEHRRLACHELAALLGPMYDVRFEPEKRDSKTGKVTRGEHCHGQFDPERPGTTP